MALSTVTLTGDLTDLIQSGVNATITLTPTTVLTDTTDHIVIPQVARSRVFTGGTFTLPGIIACDNSAITPAGWAYTITITIPGGTVLLSISAFINIANGATQDLSTLTPLSSAPVLNAYTPPGRPATLIVAASNASAAWRNSADVICTGTSDNVKINAALAALPAQGGTVLLSDGQFNITAPIIPTINNSRLLGQGPNATIIQAAAGANCNGYQYDETLQAYNLIFCAIEGITFNGGYNSGAGNTTGYGCYINYTNATHTFWDFYLRDVWFDNWPQDGFRSTCGHGYVLDHVLAEFCGGNGINFTGGFTDSPPRIVNGTVKINSGNGVMIACVDAYVGHMEISANTGSYGLVLSASGAKAVGNQIIDNTGSGVHITGGSEGCALTACTIGFNGQHGLLLDDANTTVTGNFFVNNSYSGTGGTTGAADEINVAHGTFNAGGNMITGNVIDCAASSRYGINLAHSGDTAAVLVANRIANPVTAATNFVPTDTIVIHPGVIAAGGAKVTGLGNGSAASDAAAFGQIPVADSTAAHILPDGIQAAGANGKWADSGHVHQNNADLSLYLAPTGATAETYPRTLNGNYTAALTTQQSYVTAIPLPSGLVITNLNTIIGSTGFSGVTHGWFALLDSGRVVRAVTADQTSAFGSAGTPLSIAISGSYTTPSAGLYYLVVCVTATGMGTLPLGTAPLAGSVTAPPILSGTSTGSLTTPPALLSTMGAITPAGALRFYAYTS